MRKLIILLCLCLCLGSVAAVSEESGEAGQEEMTSPAEGSVDEEDEAPDGEDERESESEDEWYEADDDLTRWDEWDEADDNDLPRWDEWDEDEAFDEGDDEDVKPGKDEPEDAEEDAEDPEAPEDPETPVETEGSLETEDAEADLPEDVEAWLYIDGEPVGGDLSDIVDMLAGDETVYIRSDRKFHLRDVSLYILAGVRFRPDPEVFGDGWTVGLYTRNADDALEPADLSGASQGDYGDLYLRVESGGYAAEEAAIDAEEDPEEEAEEETVEVEVTPSSFPTGVWVNERPTFSLSGIPEGKAWNYAALIYDHRFIPLEGDEYVPSEEGKYTLRFVIQDEMGDIRSRTENIRVWFDWTPPELNVEEVEDEDYAIDISATDATSGVVALSVDGGQHWFEFEDGDTYRYAAYSKRTLTPGMLRVRDAAGNIFKSQESYELTKKEEEEEEEEEKKSSDDETKKKKKLPHAKDNGEDADPYALKLKLPDEPMRQLIIGGKAKELTLMIERFGEQAGRAPASFTGVLTRWLTGNDDADAQLDPDTLILDAVLDLDMEETAFNCEWHFNGEVYKELSDAGIAYLGFRVGEDLCVVPTQGFTGGSKYTELKMLGVSTRKFDYTLTMKLDTDPDHMTALTDNDFCQDCDMDLSVTVENMSFALSTSVKSPMYYYDVYLAPDEMLEYPYGSYEGGGY